MKLNELFDTLDELRIDNKQGWGSVPYNQNVDYRGLRVAIKPSMFLRLAHELETPYSAGDIEKHIRSGGSIGAPFLMIAMPQDWFEGDMSMPAEIYGHEGRNRMTAALRAEGDEPVETHLFFGGEIRNRHLTPEIVKRLDQDVVSQRGNLIKGPWFSVNSSLGEVINKDVTREKFKSEKTVSIPGVGEVTLTATNLVTGRVPQFVVAATDSNGDSIGRFRFVVADYHPDERNILGFRIKSKSDPYVVAGSAHVLSSHQRKGVASAAYKFVRELGNDVKPSSSQSDAGRAMWRSFGRQMPQDELSEDGAHSQADAEVDDFLRGLTPDDVGVDTVGPYRIHYEGFTDWCNQDAEERCSLPPDDPRHLTSYDGIYDEVLRDFVAREDGKQPVSSGLVGSEDNPIFYAVFDAGPYENLSEGKAKIKLYTDPKYFGAEVDDSVGNGKPVVNIPLGDLVGFEPDDKMEDPKSAANMANMVKLIKAGKGKQLPPIFVRRYKGGYQVLDGHHRFHAYQAAGAKTIPAKLIPNDEIEVIDKVPTDETFAYGNGKSSDVHESAFDMKRYADQARSAIAVGWLDNAIRGMTYGVKVGKVVAAQPIKDLLDENKDAIVTYVLRLIKTNQAHHKENYLEDVVSMLRKLEIDWPELATIEKSITAGMNENFADGKGPGRPGDSQRHGIPKGATMAQLQKAAKAPGRKGQLARWQINMRRGRNESLTAQGKHAIIEDGMENPRMDGRGNPIVYVDMDGVLADLFGHARDLHDVDTYRKITRDQWDRFFSEADAEHLFAALSPFPTANALLRMVVRMFGGYRILSSPLSFDRDGSIRGKQEWLDRHVSVPADGRVFDHEKYRYAVQPDGTPNILIDDYGVNIDLWNRAGGIGIKYQADEDSLDDLRAKLVAASTERS